MLTHEDLKKLASVSGCCLTIFQPVPAKTVPPGRWGGDVDFAIREAGRQLTAGGLKPVECEEMLRPAREAMANMPESGRGTLVILRSPDLTVIDLQSDQLAPRVHFSKEFLILPLLPEILARRQFWLLALSIKNVRLFRSSASGLVTVPLPGDLASSLAEDGAFDKPDHSLRGRSGAGPSSGSIKGVQFGTSSAKEHQPDYLHDYFRAIDRSIRPILLGESRPLILAAVTRELAIYRKVNSYSPTLSDAVKGSPDSMDLETLHAKASQLISAHAADSEEETRQQLEDAANRDLLVTEPVQVVDAASTGQVEELIVSPSTAGRLCEETVNWAALATLRNSGTIRLLDSPATATGCAAILRFRKSALATLSNFQ